MHIEMRWYIHILALFNEKYFFLIIHYIDIFIAAIVCATCEFVFCIKHSHLREKL